MRNEQHNDDEIRRLLENSKTIAVVGLSSSPMRPSHGVGEYLQRAGYKIIPVNPNEEKVLGEHAVARLEDIREKVDIVDVFRRPEFVLEVAESAVAIGAKALWLQEGVINEEAAKRARAAGLFVAMDRCIFKEHAKRFR
jgi:uncharacterized protein